MSVLSELPDILVTSSDSIVEDVEESNLLGDETYFCPVPPSELFIVLVEKVGFSRFFLFFMDFDRADGVGMFFETF